LNDLPCSLESRIEVTGKPGCRRDGGWAFFPGKVWLEER
jgi:hypothetical protein